MTRKELKQIIGKIVNEAVQREMYKVIASGALTEVIQKGFRQAVKEYNGTVNRTSPGVDFDVPGLADIFSEPEEENAPEPVATNESMAARFRALAGSPRVIGEVERPPQMQQQQQQQRAPIIGDEPVGHMPQGRLVGGSPNPGDARLPDGEVDPAQLFEGLEQRKKQMNVFGSNAALPEGNLSESDLGRLFGG